MVYAIPAKVAEKYANAREMHLHSLLWHMLFLTDKDLPLSAIIKETRYLEVRWRKTMTDYLSHNEAAQNFRSCGKSVMKW